MSPRSAANWPEHLWVVRHGQSAGNIARDAAEATGQERIQLDTRDVDVPLSEAGRQQAEGLGHWLSSRDADSRPDVVWVSPYLRARQTAELALETAGIDVPVVVDERLREREFGVLDGLTRKGITAQWPDEAERRAVVGKFYHRPPGGESWTDALLRVRSALADVRLSHDGGRVLVVAHQVIVLLFRYVLEGMTEADVLAVDAQGDVANCSLTSYRRSTSGGLELVCFDDVGHLKKAQQPVTAEPEAAHGPR